MCLPPLAPFPKAAWRDHIVPAEWEACFDTWILLAEAHLSLGNIEFMRISAKDCSLHAFLASYVSEAALTSDFGLLGEPRKSKKLRKLCFLLINNLLVLDQPPDHFVNWGFLSEFGKVYGKKYSSKLGASLWTGPNKTLQNSLADAKIHFTTELHRGIGIDPVGMERKLKRLNYLLYCSPDIATFFMHGSDFLDGLVACYGFMNNSLRKTAISTAYLCLIGLTEGPDPNTSLLTDQLYSLNIAAGAHKSGCFNMNNSLVTELVTVTPILQQVLLRAQNSRPGFGRLKSVVAALEAFRKIGVKRKNLNKRKVYNDGEAQFHKKGLVSKVQDLFPSLGAQFIANLLDEYEDDVEQVISHLLEESLPTHLQEGTQPDALNTGSHTSKPNLRTHSTPAMITERRNIFDDDEFDHLVVETSRLHFGRRDPEKTADDVLGDRSNAPSKAAVLSALAAFDSDDDERDDTYDVEDVGGTVDSATPGNSTEEANTETGDISDKILFRAYKVNPSVYERDARTRRGHPRRALKEETGMTDEAIEGWALMLSRDTQRLRQLEANFSSFSGAQTELSMTAWRADIGGLSTEETNRAGRGGREAFRSRGERARGGRGARGNLADHAGERETEIARHRKEANKGSRANHNRRDQRAKKMARGGFLG